MRRFWKSPDEYDNKLRDLIKVTPEMIKSKESHIIWSDF